MMKIKKIIYFMVCRSKTCIFFFFFFEISSAFFFMLFAELYSHLHLESKHRFHELFSGESERERELDIGKLE